MLHIYAIYEILLSVSTYKYIPVNAHFINNVVMHLLNSML